jgi:hypothetical protein
VRARLQVEGKTGVIFRPPLGRAPPRPPGGALAGRHFLPGTPIPVSALGTTSPSIPGGEPCHENHGAFLIEQSPLRTVSRQFIDAMPGAPRPRPTGPERDELLKKAKKAEPAIEMEGWANSSELRPPKLDAMGFRKIAFVIIGTLACGSAALAGGGGHGTFAGGVAGAAGSNRSNGATDFVIFRVLLPIRHAPASTGTVGFGASTSQVDSQIRSRIDGRF